MIVRIAALVLTALTGFSLSARSPGSATAIPGLNGAATASTTR